MTKEEFRKRQLEPVEIVIISSCRTKPAEKENLREWKAGESGTFIRKYADELIATRKAVEKGSPEHKAWVEKQKAAEKEGKAAKVPTTNELLVELTGEIGELVTAIKENTAAVAEALKKK